MGKRLLYTASFFTIIFFSLCSVIAVITTNDDYALAAARQVRTEIPLNNCRGNIYDCNYDAITGKYAEQYVLAEPGRKSYHSMFPAIYPERRSEFYREIQKRQPFLMPFCQAEYPPPEDLFLKVKRYLPNPAAVHLVGYLNSSGNGVSGVERIFDDVLNQNAAGEKICCTTNARGKIISREHMYVRDEAGDRYGLMLTLDLGIQRLCETIADTMIDRGCIIVMETRTGKIKASVSVPKFNPLDISESMIKNDSSLINRALSAYNVGSVFKPLLAAAALETGINPNEKFYCDGSVEIGGHIYHCAHAAGHGNVDMQKALDQSCNGYFIWLGEKLRGDKMLYFSQRAGLGRPLYTGGKAVSASGHLPDSGELENRGALASFSFGQGSLTATPIQVTAMMNVFANEGWYIEPSLIEGIIDESKKRMKINLYHPIRQNVCSKNTAETIRRMLVHVVENGLGKKAAPHTGMAGGKTGTAQTGRTNKDGREITDAWFSGFYPAEEPQYTITVMLDSGTHGSDDAAQVFSKVADALAFYIERGNFAAE